MVINYDRRPNATIDEKIESLSESVMLALNEMQSSYAVKIEALEKEIKALRASIQ